MKSIISLIGLFFLTPLWAQHPPEGTNEIVVVVDMPRDEAYEYITKDLLINNYYLQTADPSAGIIETRPFIVRWGFIDADIMEVSFRYQVEEHDEGSQIVISGIIGLGSGDLSNPSMPIAKTGPKHSATLTAWQMMWGMAKRLPSTDPMYRVSSRP